jgi:hypothetical protein
MRKFKAGDRVKVVRPNLDHLAYEGRVGVCVDDGARAGGLIAVKGLGSRTSEMISGYPGFYAEELDHA